MRTMTRPHKNGLQPMNGVPNPRNYTARAYVSPVKVVSLVKNLCSQPLTAESLAGPPMGSPRGSIIPGVLRVLRYMHTSDTAHQTSDFFLGNIVSRLPLAQELQRNTTPSYSRYLRFPWPSRRRVSESFLLSLPLVLSAGHFLVQGNFAAVCGALCWRLVIAIRIISHSSLELAYVVFVTLLALLLAQGLGACEPLGSCDAPLTPPSAMSPQKSSHNRDVRRAMQITKSYTPHLVYMTHLRNYR